MNLKFQYNKISQLQLIKQLAVRQRALPTLKNKESALRLEVKKARDQAFALDQGERTHSRTGCFYETFCGI